MPTPVDPTSLLARHEAGLFDEAREVMGNLGAGHRSEGFNRLVLPLCQRLIESIGHRMAYEAAVKARVNPDLLALYVAGVVKHDSRAALPKLEEFLEATGARPYCIAPIVSDESWARFVENLPHFGGEAILELIPGVPTTTSVSVDATAARL